MCPTSSINREPMSGFIVWRDKVDVPSKCTIVRTMGRYDGTGVRPQASSVRYI
jgi:hypothetical protein